MRTLLRAAAFICVIGVPSIAYAQAELTGTARDTSGAVLPGVTVEARSPALIEGVRTAVTDGTGQYRIINLRPGVYSVTFMLPGFNTIVREDVELSGSGVFQVNGEMLIGALEETITVTGEAPLIDVSNTTRQTVLDQELIDALPTVARYYTLGALIPGVVPSTLNTGGASGDIMASLSIHGGDNSGQRILSNGVNTSGIAGGGNISGVVPNANAAAEILMDTSAVSAELSQGGVRINYIPRDGGNTFSMSLNGSFSTSGLQGDNFTQRLQDLGLRTPDTVERITEVSGGFGGPILRDKLWFWIAGQDFTADNARAGAFYNLNAFNPDAWTYEADESRPGITKGHWYNIQGRFTYQATPRNKIAVSYDTHDHCRCPDGISATRAPEAAADRRFPHQMLYTAEWTAPLTSRLLVELVGLHRTTRWGNMEMRWTFPEEHASGAMAQMVAVEEQSTGLRYRARNLYNSNFNHNYFFRGAVSYVTGAHNFKAGFTDLTGWLENTSHTGGPPVEYRFNRGVPNRITSRAVPILTDVTLPLDLGFFVQDRWTVDRLTMNVGLRYDHLRTGWPALDLGPTELTPNRNISFPAVDNNISWHDMSYRFGAAYDLRGDGRTAVKVSANRYIEAQTSSGIGSSPHPNRTLVNTVFRSWNDANQDFVPDCDLTSTAGNGECGPMSNSNFGTTVPGALFDEDALKGWRKRGYDWEFSAGVQHELLTGLSVDVGYFRRIFGNQRVSDNLLVGPSDFDTFSIVAPTDPRLPGGGGQTISDLYNVKPGSFQNRQNFTTLARNFGSYIEHWNGVDVSFNARRLYPGLTVQGGVSTGRRSENTCDIRRALPETAPTNPFCDIKEPWLTQVKLLGIYTIPRVDVLVSGTLQSYKGPEIGANFRANNSVVSPSLGRPLSGGQRSVTIPLISADSEYGERLNQLDVRVGKVIRVAGTRATVNLDVYNLLNVDTITRQINTFGGAWLRPTGTVLARFAKISATFDF